MSRPLPFDVDPWSIGLAGIHLTRLAHAESVFALSNGNLGWRGNLDEGEPCSRSGSYLNGVFEAHPMPYAEDGYGYPDHGQSVINVPDGKIMRLVVDDDPFDVRRGTVHRHEQRLDFRTGTLRRDVMWTAPSGGTVQVVSTRLVSLRHRSVAAVRYEVTATERPVEITLQSEIVAGDAQPETHPDPRVQEVLDRALEPAGHFTMGSLATLVHRTRRSGIGIAVAMDHDVENDGGKLAGIDTVAEPHLARTTVRARLGVGDRLVITKFVGHEWDPDAAPPALRDRAEGAVAEARKGGWDDLVASQRAQLDDYWRRADVEVEGSVRLQQAVRFAMFHLYQAAARMELRSVPGKGLTGSGYQGHTFWDFEGFVLPVLISTAPEAAEQALRWRHATLPAARTRARELGFEGAAFAWRTIDGRESSGYWAASTAALHVNADIAGAVVAYVRATGDERFERDAGAEILVETARLWMSVGRWDAGGAFHLDGVTGPDEYSALADDNVFTNLSAKHNLSGAAAAAGRHPEVARALGVTDDEIGSWVRAASAMAVPFDAGLGVHPQDAAFTRHARWDFGDAGDYPLQDHHPYLELYRKQVVKQADLVLALLFFHDEFTAQEKAADFAYYEGLTVRDSSLSAAVQAVIAAEVGHLDLAADYLAEAATIDLDDLHGNIADGLHLASLGGIWLAFTAGFGGVRANDDGLHFAPRLPPQITRLRFGIRVRAQVLHIEIDPGGIRYHLAGGDDLVVRHFGEELRLRAGETTVAAAVGPPEVGPRPTQPPGREPRDFSHALAG